MERAFVSAATGVMSSVLGKLADLLHEEYKLAKGVRKDIEFLRSELSAMNDLLYVLAEVEELDAINKGWRDRVRELAYDVEDCIDLSVARLGRADDAEKQVASVPSWRASSRRSECPTRSLTRSKSSRIVPSRRARGRRDTSSTASSVLLLATRLTSGCARYGRRPRSSSGSTDPGMRSSAT